MQAGESLQDQMSLFRTWYTPQRRPTLINRSLAQKKQDFVGSFIDSRTTPCPSIYCEGQSRARVGPVCQYLCRVVRASDATATATQDRSLIAGNDAWITGPRLAPSAVPATVLSFPLRYTQPRVECPSFILRSAASRSFALCSSFPATAARPPARC